MKPPTITLHRNELYKQVRIGEPSSYNLHIQKPKKEVEKLGPEVSELIATEMRRAKPITVPEKLRAPHPLVRETREVPSRVKPDEYGVLRPWRKRYLNIRVAPTSLNRALRIMNALIKGRSLILKENNKRLRYLSEEEIERLLRECSRHLRRIVECALNTGMRRGEMLNLKWSKVRNGFIYLQKTKTNESRQIPINDDLAELFKEIGRETQLQSEYVFPFRKGEHSLKGKNPAKRRKGPAPAPQAIESMKTSFKSALRRAGIEDFRFYDLRHSFASHMIMRGATIKEVQEILGHKNISMTMRYAHLSQEHKKKAVNLLTGLTASPKPADGTCHKSVTSAKSANSPTG